MYHMHIFVSIYIYMYIFHFKDPLAHQHPHLGAPARAPNVTQAAWHVHFLEHNALQRQKRLPGALAQRMDPPWDGWDLDPKDGWSNMDGYYSYHMLSWLSK